MDIPIPTGEYSMVRNQLLYDWGILYVYISGNLYAHQYMILTRGVEFIHGNPTIEAYNTDWRKMASDWRINT